MASLINRRLEALKSSSRINDAKATKLVTQSRKSRIQMAKGDKRKVLLEKRVFNSLTELIALKNADDFKHTLVFNILVKNIMNYLLESGKCRDEKSCLAAAKKMAAFVSDVMKETYRKQKLVQKSEVERSKLKMKEPMPKIPEETVMKKEMRTAEPKADKRKETRAAPSVSKTEVNIQYKPATSSSKAASKSKGDFRVEKEKLNSWLDDVSDRTKKWSEWIRDTVDHAETSKNRIKSGDSLRSVSTDWKTFIHGKDQESKVLKEYSNVWKGDETEAFKRRGQESIQQWLLKNKMKSMSKDPSNYSTRTPSSDSMCSVWSSRAPSSLFSGDSEMAKFKQLGMFR